MRRTVRHKLPLSAALQFSEGFGQVRFGGQWRYWKSVRVAGRIGREPLYLLAETWAA